MHGFADESTAIDFITQLLIAVDVGATSRGESIGHLEIVEACQRLA